MEVTAEGAAVVEASQFPLKLTMILNKTTFEVNEPVGIHFFLENIGNETYGFYWAGLYVYFKVYDEKGSGVYNEYEDVFTQVLPRTVEIPPGLGRRVNCTWYQHGKLVYQGLGEDPPAYYKEVPPGRYKIVGFYDDIGSYHNISRRFTVETPPITITIVS